MDCEGRVMQEGHDDFSLVMLQQMMQIPQFDPQDQACYRVGFPETNNKKNKKK
jgi:hypothetical protein